MSHHGQVPTQTRSLRLSSVLLAAVVLAVTLLSATPGHRRPGCSRGRGDREARPEPVGRRARLLLGLRAPRLLRLERERHPLLRDDPRPVGLEPEHRRLEVELLRWRDPVRPDQHPQPRPADHRLRQHRQRRRQGDRRTHEQRVGPAQPGLPQRRLGERAQPHRGDGDLHPRARPRARVPAHVRSLLDHVSHAPDVDACGVVSPARPGYYKCRIIDSSLLARFVRLYGGRAEGPRRLPVPDRPASLGPAPGRLRLRVRGTCHDPVGEARDGARRLTGDHPALVGRLLRGRAASQRAPTTPPRPRPAGRTRPPRTRTTASGCSWSTVTDSAGRRS